MAQRYARGIGRIGKEGEAAEQAAYSIEHYKAEQAAYSIEHYKAEQRAYHIEHNMDYSHAAGVFAGAYAGDERGYAGAYVKAHYNRYSHAVCYHARKGQRLQYAHAGGAALDYACEYHAHKHAEHGIIKGSKYACKLRNVLQRGYGIAHHGHAEHKYCKAHHNAAHIAPLLRFAYHYHNYAYKGDNWGEVFGLEHAQKHAAAVYARKGEYPSGERCAYVAAHYHARGLLKIEYAAVNKADKHYRKG